MTLLKVRGEKKIEEYMNADMIEDIRVETETGGALLTLYSVNFRATWRFADRTAKDVSGMVADLLGNLESYGHVVNFERLMYCAGGKRC